MNLLYASLSYVPSRRASSVQVMKMCSAFVAAGHRVTLLSKSCPDRLEPDVNDDFAFYGVPHDFEIRKLPRPAWRGGGIVHAAAVSRTIAASQGRVDLVYSRDVVAATAAALLRVPFVFEAHGIPHSGFERMLWRRALGSPALEHLVVISRALREELGALQILPPGTRVVVAHDAADGPGRDLAPRLRRGRFRVGYVGNLYEGRGIELILKLAARLLDVEFHLIGGQPHHIEAWKRHVHRENVQLRGFVPPGHLPACYAELDVLLMPFSQRVVVASGSDTSRWMSPMKMFEYMAAGRPILASDLPVLREVLRHGENAWLLPPDDAEAWARAIVALRASPDTCRTLAENAHRDLVKHFTWRARAEAVLPRRALMEVA